MGQNELQAEDLTIMEEILLAQLDARVAADRAKFAKALALFQQGYVTQTTVAEGEVHFFVTDGERHAVVLDLQLVYGSMCSACEEDFCVHILAAFLSVYASLASVQDFIVAFHHDPVQDVTDKYFGNRSASPAQTTPQEQPSLTSWLSLFHRLHTEYIALHEERFDFYPVPMLREKIASQTLQHYFHTLLRHQPATPFSASLYTIVAGTTALLKFQAYVEEYGLDFYNLASHVTELIDHLEHILRSLKTMIPSIKERALMNDCLPYFDELLRAEGKFQYLYTLCYRIVWTHLPVEMEQRYAKDEQLLAELHTLAPAKTVYAERSMPHALHVALVHFAYLLRAEKVMYKRAQALPATDVQTGIYFFELTTERKQYEQLHFWLELTKEKFKAMLQREGSYKEKRKVANMLLHYYEKYRVATRANAVFIVALKDMLPYSLPVYDDYLVENKYYREWIELQLLMKTDIESLSTYYLRQIEIADRALLLPLYHEGVRQAVAERKRTSYRLAVQRLKVLKTHYLMLGQGTRWHFFITTFKEKHRRLRALQDELRKGNLIDE